MGYKQLDGKYAANVWDEKENFKNLSSHHPAWGACVRSSVCKILPASDWIACEKKRFSSLI